MVGVASLVMGGVRESCVSEWEVERSELQTTYQEAMQDIAARKVRGLI